MIQYILECIVFQLVFLVIYDLFLKRETFFQWNRLYLIVTYVLSMVLPWVKIEAMKTTVSPIVADYPEFLWNINNANAVQIRAENTTFHMPWQQIVVFSGMLVAALFLGYKLLQIFKLRKQGQVYYYKDFTQVIIANSAMAFSFFKSIFLGDKVLMKEHDSIVQHELVHIRQRHSYDLMFFELMRIVGWFNPLVYVYQNRISELHEFIADAQVAKSNKKEQYQQLLSQVFQTQHISFINQFFKSSLIKKRIVMLTKEKSKQVFKLKYLLLVPLVFGMLAYTAIEPPVSSSMNNGEYVSTEEIILVDNIEKLTLKEEELIFEKLQVLQNRNNDWILYVKDNTNILKFSKSTNGSHITGPNNEKIYAKMIYESSLKDKTIFANLDAEIQAKKDLAPKVLEADNLNNTKVVIHENTPLKQDVDRLKQDVNEVSIDIAAVRQEPEVFTFSNVDQVPIFPGCENEKDTKACFQKSIQRHISKNFNYPKEAQEKGIQGRVAIIFTMNTSGEIVKVKTRGPDKLLEEEAKRIIARMPTVKPGQHKGEKVNVTFSIPITFKLNKSKKKKKLDEYDNKNNVPFATVDEVPVFPGCEDSSDTRKCFSDMMLQHISKNFHYPEEAQKKGIQGRVSVMFIISDTGDVEHLKMRGPDPILEAEVSRIIGKLPKMTPGKQNGKSINVPFSIPISFKLQEDDLKNKDIYESSDTGIDPLVYIDGKKADKQRFLGLNKDEIATVNVLKGEAAIKKYGAEAKHGVVEITMKK